MTCPDGTNSHSYTSTSTVGRYSARARRGGHQNLWLRARLRARSSHEEMTRSFPSGVPVIDCIGPLLLHFFALARDDA